MFPLRLAVAILAATLFALSAEAQPPAAQTPIERMLLPYKKPAPEVNDPDDLLSKLKDGTAAISDKAKAVIREKIQSIAYKVTWAEYHEAPKSKDDTLQPRKPEKTVDRLIDEARNELAKPVEGAKKLTDKQVAYQREYGAALYNAAQLLMLDKDPPPLLRTNAARLLVPAAESAAPAVGRGLTALLAGRVFKDEKKAPAPTPPDVLYYALRATEAFLDKYDITKPGTTDLSNDELGELVGLLIQFVEKGPPILDQVSASGAFASDQPAARDAAQATARAAAVRFYRLQAIRALGKARADGYPTKTTTLRPMYTLAKVALGDPTVQPPPSVKEVGEAALGLMNMTVGQEVNADALAYTVAAGATAHFRPRADNTADKKLVDWRASAQRFADAAAKWEEAVSKNPAVPEQGKTAVKNAVKAISAQLCDPLLKANAQKSDPDVNEMTQWLSGLKAGLPSVLINDGRDKDKYKLTYPER